MANKIQRVLKSINDKCGNDVCNDLLAKVDMIGEKPTLTKQAKLMYEKSDNIEEFLTLLNNNHIGGGYLHVNDTKIIGIYDRCYCGIPKLAKDISPTYCECSAGWFEKLFSSVLEKEVMVKRIDTILNGAEKCTFEISF